MRIFCWLSASEQLQTKEQSPLENEIITIVELERIVCLASVFAEKHTVYHC